MALNRIFIKGSKVIILVYDITSDKSFRELKYWVETIKELLREEVIYAIVGNKVDLYLEQRISKEDGEKYAEENGAFFYTTSSKYDSKGFQKFVDKLVEKYINNKIDKISEEKNEKNLL